MRLFFFCRVVCLTVDRAAIELVLELYGLYCFVQVRACVDRQRNLK